MKKKRIAALICAALCVIFCASCNKENRETQITSPVDGDQVSVRGLVGRWSVPESEWLVAGKSEIWEFTADGKYYHHQLGSDGSIADTVDGTYRIDGDMLVLTVSGWEQPACAVVFPDNDTMAFTNHEKTVMLTRTK